MLVDMFYLRGHVINRVFFGPLPTMIGIDTVALQDPLHTLCDFIRLLRVYGISRYAIMYGIDAAGTIGADDRDTPRVRFHKYESKSLKMITVRLTQHHKKVRFFIELVEAFGGHASMKRDLLR